MKFEERTSDGIFLGWHVNLGPRYSGDYLIFDFEAYTSNPSGATPRRVKEVFDSYDRTFPLRIARDQVKREMLVQTICDQNAVDAPEQQVEMYDVAVQIVGLETIPEGLETSLPDQPLPKGYELQAGRVTRVQTTTRPPYILPELWKMCNRREKDRLIREYRERR